MGGSTPKQRVVEYYLSLHYGICHGVVDKIVALKIAGKNVGRCGGFVEGVYSLDLPELFGGIKKEGGIRGRVAFQVGTSDQKLDAHVASKHGGTPDTTPGYRGLATAYFTEEVGADRKGFYWSGNQPYVPPMWMQVERIGRDWLPAIAAIPGKKVTIGASFYVAIDNGAHMYGAGNWHQTVKDGMSLWLDSLRGEPTNIRLVAYGNVALGSIERFNCDDSDYDALIAFVEGLTAPGAAPAVNVTQDMGDTVKTTSPAPKAYQTTPVFEKGGLNTNSYNNVVFTPEFGVFTNDIDSAVGWLYHYVDLSGLPNGTQFNYQNQLKIYTNFDTSVGNRVSVTAWTQAQLDADGVGTTTIFVNEAFGTGGSDSVRNRNFNYTPPNNAVVLRFKEEVSGPFYFSGLYTKTAFTQPVVTYAGGAAVNDWGPATDSSGAFFSSVPELCSPRVVLLSGTEPVSGSEIAAKANIEATSGVKTAPIWMADSADLSTADVSTAEFIDSTPYDGYGDANPSDSVPVVDASDPGALSAALGGSYTTEFTLADMNPVHIIRECLTNSQWGRGLPDTTIDDASFTAAAETIYAERFGLSLSWVKQTDVESIITEIVDHINAAFFADPSTGLWTLTLIRGDYDIGALPLFDESNSTVVSYKRRSPSEAINEIIVSWTNPENEETEVVNAQNLGGIIANNGEVVSDSRNYYAVRRPDLAADLAARDLAVVSAPLASFELLIDRSAWDLTPGAVAKITSAEHYETELVCRVLKVNYGKPGDSKIRATFSEDIFSFTKPRAKPAPVSIGGTLGADPAVPDTIEFMTANYYLNGISGFPDAEYPDATGVLLVSTTEQDTLEVEVYSDEVAPTGAAVMTSLGSRDLTAQATLTEVWTPEPETISALPGDLSVGQGPQVGGFAIVGDVGLAEDAHEIVLLVSEAAGSWTVKRGILDTTPQQWAPGTPIRFLSTSSNVTDPVTRTVLVSTDYEFRTRTSKGLLPVPVPASYATSERYYAPARPANVKVNGVGFGAMVNPPGGALTVTWANRNRISEEVVVLAWGDVGVAPEAGQTTTVIIFDYDTGSEITRDTGLAGEAHVVPYGSLGGAAAVRVQVISERDGFESIQGHELVVVLDGGYGQGYGKFYGGI